MPCSVSWVADIVTGIVSHQFKEVVISMSDKQVSDKKKTGKEALKALRKQRKASIDRARQAIKTQNKEIKAIRLVLKDGGKTVLEIAKATQMPTSRALRYVATMKKYGSVAEGPKEDDYFKYELAGE